MATVIHGHGAYGASKALAWSAWSWCELGRCGGEGRGPGRQARGKCRTGPGAQVMNEIKVMLQAGFHPNLASLLGWYVDPDDSTICLVMGCCEGGTLAALLKVSWSR